MQKKLLSIIITLVLVYSLTLTTVHAATPTTSTSDSASSSAAVGEKLNEQINQLKERIASRVAELNLVEKRGIIGTVKETTGNQITITDMTGKTRFVDVDEITKFSSPNSKNFGLSDLTKGTKISVLGLYNKQSQRILARYIGVFIIPTYTSGRISSIDSKNFTITIISEDQKETKIDIDTTATLSIYTKEDGMSKYGFSKFEIGDKISATGFPDKKDPNMLVASRILILPELPQNPKIIIKETDSATASASTTP